MATWPQQISDLERAIEDVEAVLGLLEEERAVATLSSQRDSGSPDQSYRDRVGRMVSDTYNYRRSMERL